LAGHIKRLEAELAAMREERDKAQHERDEARGETVEADKAQAALATQLDALNAVLAVERRRADERAAAERERAEEWKAVADRFASQAERLTAAAEARRGWWPWRRSA
jgi:chromosome segregation ATPase